MAAALREQMLLWSKASSGPSDLDLAERRCMVGEFLTRSGQARQAVEVLKGQRGEWGLSADIRARRLGLLADAILCDTCFGGSDAHVASVIPLLEEALGLWRAAPAEECDEAGLAQALSNLCFQFCQTGEFAKAENFGRESMRIFSRLGHPRLGQAEQHMAHVLKAQDLHDEALAMYKQSVATFERMGSSKFDTEYCCSLEAISVALLEADESPFRSAIAWRRAAVVSCEAITGPDHTEARYYRRNLVYALMFISQHEEAAEVLRGAPVSLTREDQETMRAT